METSTATPAATATAPIVEKPLSWFQPAAYNPRVDLAPGDPDYENLKRSITHFGHVQVLVANKDGTLIGGHQTLKVLKDLGRPTARAVVMDLPPREEKALNVALNKIGGRWDDAKLADLLVDLDVGDGVRELTGFKLDEIKDLLGDANSGADTAAGARRTLRERFVVPPFSVLDARQGYWQDRKRAWLSLGVAPEAGRENLGVTVNSSEGKYDYMTGRGNPMGGSAFDPVLCEVAYRWFCPPRGKVLDPFAGESVKGLVAGYMGIPYTGVELRQGQVDANEKQAKVMKPKVRPRWICGDSTRLKKQLPAKQLYDLVFTSPPYFDLEVYSDDRKDGSTKRTYKDFTDWLEVVFHQAADLLRYDRFFVVKVGDVRDKKTGAYRNFVGDTVAMMTAMGLSFYNDAILVTPAGTLPVRTSAQFPKTRKMGKTHQNVLVFYKGDPRQISKHVHEGVEYGDPEFSGETASS